MVPAGRGCVQLCLSGCAGTCCDPRPGLAALGVSPPSQCQGWCLFQQHGLVPVLDYPLPTSGRGKSSPTARWCRLIPFLGEAGLCLCPCEQDPGEQHRLRASSLRAQQFPLWKWVQSIPKSISELQAPLTAWGSVSLGTPAPFGLVIPLPCLQPCQLSQSWTSRLG